VKLKNISDFNLLQQVAAQRNVKIEKQVPNMPLWYILSLNPNSSDYSFEISNFFYETGFFEDVDPAFMFDFKPTCTNDTMFGSLWGLNNISNPNIDINACQAWNISQGANVNVAILDQGVDKVHNDLSSNISPTSFNCQTGTSPSGTPDTHGTHVAGIVGAVRNNNLQVVGVAPQSKLMSISHPLTLTPNISAELASGISFAWQNGAAAINNSWGDQGGTFFNQLHSTILENSIVNAMTQGRNGKGTLVIFAAGNFGGSGPIMDYPANFHDDIIAVGSITSTGVRSNFSGFGPRLDVVAPGSGILSTSPGNNTTTLSGTSMAAPHVTGIVALILAVNPNLTRCQVTSIIEGTSQKIGGYSYTVTSGRPSGTWNNEMGYGLVDAFAAVQAASPSISGPSLFCGNQSQFLLSAVPAGVTVTWTSNNPTGVSINVNTGLATRINNYDGPVTIYAHMNGPCGISSVSYFVWVGKPVGGPSGEAVVYPGQLYTYAANPLGYALVTSWEVDGGVIFGGGGFGSNTVTIYWNTDGYVAYTSENGCGVGGGIMYVTVSLEGGCDPCQISLPHPNPANHELIVEFNQQRADSIRMANKKSPVDINGSDFGFDVEYSLKDYMGNQSYYFKSASRTPRLDLSNVPSGTYILTIRYGSIGVDRHRIVVNK
jgi:subtilisin family serine protease